MHGHLAGHVCLQRPETTRTSFASGQRPAVASFTPPVLQRTSGVSVQHSIRHRFTGTPSIASRDRRRTDSSFSYHHKQQLSGLQSDGNPDAQERRPPPLHWRLRPPHPALRRDRGVCAAGLFCCFRVRPASYAVLQLHMSVGLMAHADVDALGISVLTPVNRQQLVHLVAC